MATLAKNVIDSIGFAFVGSNVQISDKASFYGANRISIGDNVRIDDFCVLSAGFGGIEIGSHIHIAIYTSIIGAGKVILDDFCNLSSRVSIYSSNDDYSGATLTNPTIPDKYKNVSHAPVYLGRHVIVGSGTVILPGVRLEEGVAVGALSLITKSCEAFGIYAGNPARRIKDRKRDLLEVEKQFLASNKRISCVEQ
jgi:acetyltransferase-like isoleucine patch superfamily enzyme